MTTQEACFVYYYDTKKNYPSRIYVLEGIPHGFGLLPERGWEYGPLPGKDNGEEAWWTTDREAAEWYAVAEAIGTYEEAAEQWRVMTAKRAKLADMMSRMDWRDRLRFEESRRNHKPNLDHDLFVVSLHIPIDTGLPPNAPATQYRITEIVGAEYPEQLALSENEEKEEVLT